MCLSETHDDVDVADRHALGRLGDAVDADRVAGDVHQFPVLLDEEMIVVRRVRVEICLAALYAELAQEAGLGELVQRVVDSGERHMLARGQRLGMKDLGRDVAVAGPEQERAEHEPLASSGEGRTSAGAP